jgi:excisionase family DNA binding protein
MPRNAPEGKALSERVFMSELKALTREDRVVGPLLHSVNEAAFLLGLSVRNITAMIERNELRSRKIGGRRLIARKELERFAAEGPWKGQ